MYKYVLDMRLPPPHQKACDQNRVLWLQQHLGQAVKHTAVISSPNSILKNLLVEADTVDAEAVGHVRLESKTWPEL